MKLYTHGSGEQSGEQKKSLPSYGKALKVVALLVDGNSWKGMNLTTFAVPKRYLS